MESTKDFELVVDEIYQLECETFGEYGWSKDEISEKMLDEKTINVFHRTKSRLLGYLFAEKLDHKIQLFNLVVAHDVREQGIGTELIRHIKGRLDNTHRELFLYVRERNVAAQLFFKKQGFRATTIMKHFFEVVDEDAYIMNYLASYETQTVTKTRKPARTKKPQTKKP